MQKNGNLPSGPQCACFFDDSHLAPAAVSHPRLRTAVSLLALRLSHVRNLGPDIVSLTNGCRSFEAGDAFARNVGNHLPVGRDSSVGTAARYVLEGLGIKSRWREISVPIQTGLGSHPASYTMGTWSFPEVYTGRGVALTTHPHIAPRLRKE
jgi:hypothetical protein